MLVTLLEMVTDDRLMHPRKARPGDTWHKAREAGNPSTSERVVDTDQRDQGHSTVQPVNPSEVQEKKKAKGTVADAGPCRGNGDVAVGVGLDRALCLCQAARKEHHGCDQAHNVNLKIQCHACSENMRSWCEHHYERGASIDTEMVSLA